ncbi:hypothetical protein G6011_07927 [Alternaria panax]|uniref:Uncharacterized protein n=1 Tax=Alternaria panax TaxID=48097 RepID=A0AAD4I4F1_9PLEO|nr:hypothetical protein G6011_07927 [Alternaria panax]
MRNPNGCRVVLLLLPPLLLLGIAALTNILESISKDNFEDCLDRDIRSGARQIVLSRPGGTASNDTTVTVDINNGPTYVILGLIILGYGVSLLSAAGTWQLRRTEGTAAHERKWTWVVFVANIVMVGASLGVFGYVTSVQGSDESWQNYEDVGREDQEHTRETWACQISQFYPDRDWAGTACRTAKAMRFLLIPMAVAALSVFISLWLLVRARGGAEWMFGGKGRYAGFANVYEMRPPGPPSPYNGPPGQQWVQQPWPAQPGQQWVGQPVQQQWAPQAYQQWGPQVVVQQPVSQAPKPDATVDQRPVYG